MLNALKRNSVKVHALSKLHTYPFHRLRLTTTLKRNPCPTTQQRHLASTSTTLPFSPAQQSTIYALSTAPGKAGVAVFRVSGPEALSVYHAMVRPFGKGKAKDPEPWKMVRCRIVHPLTDEVLDDGLAVFFQAPKSYTTKPTLEIHTHSGPALISSILRALGSLPYTRQAEPGEFTRLAFLAGRMDLTQVEGVMDLIDAQTEAQRRGARGAVGGETRRELEGLRSGIIKCQALIEAVIDFGEGEDIEDGVVEDARHRAKDLLKMIQSHLSDARRGEILRSGIKLAIFGPPNAGKSSLLNFLAQREAAIVTPIPGTTRDILELSLDIGGLPVIVADTAGLRHTQDVVEQIGVEKARKAVQNADIALCVLSLPEASTTTGELAIPEELKPLVTTDTFFLLNKSDLASPPKHVPLNRAWTASLQTGQGTQEFLSEFGEWLKQKFELSDVPESRTPIIARERHRMHLESAARFLQAFLDTPPNDVIFAAEELRYAAQAVGRVTGAIDVEDILDVVFRDFCIGK